MQTKENARPDAANIQTGKRKIPQREYNTTSPPKRQDASPIFDFHSRYDQFSTTESRRQDEIIQYETKNVFQTVKDAVSVPAAAVLYGFPPNRAGFIRCPFHAGGNEKTPSCHLKERYFKCFACQTGGSVIDFTARLFNLPPLDAVKRLNADFHVGLPLEARAPAPEELEAARKRREAGDTAERFKAWKQRADFFVSRAIAIGNDALIHRTPAEWTETEVYAVKQKPRLESFIDDLEAGDDGKQLSSLRDWGEVFEIANRICNGEFSGNP